VPFLPVPLAASATFAAIVFAWVPFRSPDMSTAWAVWSGMLGANGAAIPNVTLLGPLARRFGMVAQPIAGGGKGLAILLGALAIAWLAPTSQELTRTFRLGLDSPGYNALPGPSAGRFELRANVPSAMALGVLFGFTLRFLGDYSEFIYFQF
jgi:hypothetical protein